MFIAHCHSVTLSNFITSICSRLLVQIVSALLCGNWQDFNWHNASRGPSATAELLVSFNFSMHSISEWYGPNTRAYSDLPAVDILNLIHKAAAAMSPLATSFVQLVYFAVLTVLFIELF